MASSAPVDTMTDHRWFCGNPANPFMQHALLDKNTLVEMGRGNKASGECCWMAARMCMCIIGVDVVLRNAVKTEKAMPFI